jgi:hypothetical protein
MEATNIFRYVREEAMNDPEFARAMRYFTGTFKVAVDDEEAAFAYSDGKLIPQADASAGSEPEIEIRGTSEHWDRMLEEFPVPFYQCLQTSSIKHGMFLNNTKEFYAYLPALNRLTALLRAENVKRVGVSR